MKKLLLIALAFSMSYAINAQVETPAPSPLSKLEVCPPMCPWSVPCWLCRGLLDFMQPTGT